MPRARFHSQSQRWLATALVLAAGLLAPHAVRAADPPVLVHVDDPETRLQQLDGSKWTVICEGRCDRSVPFGQYRLTEKSAAPLDEFHIDGKSANEFVVRANRDKTGLKGLGAIVVIAGGILSVVALGASFSDSLHCIYSDSSHYSKCESERDGLILRDGLLGVGGIVAIGIGVAIFVVAGHQKNIVFSRGRPPPAPPPPAPRNQHRPSWLLGESSSPVRGAASAFMIPIFTGHF